MATWKRTGPLAVFSLALALSARASQTVEAGPEDGIPCCNGIDRFLLDGDQVMIETGRAGIFRSERRGEGWSRSMQGLLAANGVAPFADYVCQANSHPQVVYALAGLGGFLSPFSGLFSSEDFGTTWTRRAALSTGFGFAFCDVDPDDPRTVYVDTLGASFLDETWKSTDGARTVQQVGDTGLAFLRAGSGIVFFLSDFAPVLLASTDGGTTLFTVPTPPAASLSFDASPDGRVLFVSTFDEARALTGTFRSVDGGASWIPVSGAPFGIGIYSLTYDPSDASRLYLRDGLLRLSRDGGLSFELLPASSDPRFLRPFPIQAAGVDARGSIFVGTEAGPFRSDDGGLSFRPMLDGFRASAVQDLALDAEGKLLVGVLHTQLVFRQGDGLDFRPIGNAPALDVASLGNDGLSVASSPTDPAVVLVATSGQGLMRTEDGGLSWSPADVGGVPFFFDSRMAFATGTRVYLVSGFVAGLFRSDDAGRTFARLSRVPFGAIAVDPIDPDVLYVGDYRGASGLFKSTDGGLTLQDLGHPGSFSALLVDRRDPGVIYAGERFGQVLRSADGGRTFAPASAGLGGAGVHGLAQDASGRVFAWLRGGGLFFTDDGSRWRPGDTVEALQRSGVEAGRGALVADPRRPGRLYLGNAGVLQVDAH
jgi:photosystem II stability/assembly factor-like uncharacterized protein